MVAIALTESLRVEIALPRTADSPFYAQHLDGFTFYKMTSLDNRIANADQLLAQDVDRFCEGIVELYSNLSKPSGKALCCSTFVNAAQRTVGGGGGTKICRLFIGGLSHETTDEQSHFFTLVPPIFGTVSSRPNLQLSIIGESIEIRRLIVPHLLRDRNVHSSTSKAKQFNERDESVRA
ncbi:hypothetical protein niasHS_016518 [Heterodera schachtii]|uniref:ABC transmembrane type-1 domain-containing protein n=1 Tax=Heterodera schachtii TaxID=97005 RepID=A0ABD2I8F9_HETSC